MQHSRLLQRPPSKRIVCPHCQELGVGVVDGVNLRGQLWSASLSPSRSCCRQQISELCLELESSFLTFCHNPSHCVQSSDNLKLNSAITMFLLCAKIILMTFVVSVFLLINYTHYAKNEVVFAYWNDIKTNYLGLAAQHQCETICCRKTSLFPLAFSQHTATQLGVFPRDAMSTAGSQRLRSEIDRDRRLELGERSF